MRPFLLGVYGTPDGDPRDRQLSGFEVPPTDNDSTQWATDMLGHFDRSSAAGGRRDYSCPARLRGVRTDAPANNPYAIGANIADSAPASRTARAAAERMLPYYLGTCGIRTLGNTSHVGILSQYSNPGTLVGSAGVRVFPARGHEVTGWYMYRGMTHSGLLETAFAPEIQAGTIRKIRRDLYHEIGGFWQWTLNPHFDIRLAGNAAIAGDGSRDLAHLADCDPAAGSAGPVKVKPRRCGGMPASGRASSDLSPSSYRESGSPDSLALLCTVYTRRPQVGQKSVHFGLFYAMKTPG